MKPAAVIFDLDGTLIDNNAYHIEAWKNFYSRLGREFTLEEYKTKINGRINREIFNYVLNKELSPAEIDAFTNEKEELYRTLYAPYIKPVPGLIIFLNQLREASVPVAIATSGLPVNINFMFEKIPLKEYFSVVVDATYIQNGKPHPEIFLKTAEALQADPVECVAFEDSVAGVQSAKDAGMKVVALTTTHTKEDVKQADLIIKDYTEIDLATLQQLFS